jgi:hypothetical protein
MYGDPRPLFIVTVAVILGLIGFVAYVLLKVKEPWVRSTPLAIGPGLAGVKSASLEPAADEAPADEKKEALAEPQEDKPKND